LIRRKSPSHKGGVGGEKGIKNVAEGRTFLLFNPAEAIAVRSGKKKKRIRESLFSGNDPVEKKRLPSSTPRTIRIRHQDAMKPRSSRGGRYRRPKKDLLAHKKDDRIGERDAGPKKKK